MKKQFFLLSLLFTSVNGLIQTDSCNTGCNTSCNTGCSANNCSTNCVPEHGHTFRADRAAFVDASPERVSLFNSDVVNNLMKKDKHGEFQVVVFGGKATKASSAAAYYLPYGHSALTFDGSVKAQTFASVVAESVVSSTATATSGVSLQDELGLQGMQLGVGYKAFATDPATYKFDSNTDTSKILPWNFGITYAALFDPRGAAANGSNVGTGLISAPAFKSTINPCLNRWNVGAGLELRYQFSDEADGWYGKISTAVQTVRSKINLNENVETEKVALTQANFPGASQNPFGSANGSISPTLANANGNAFPIGVTAAPLATGIATAAPVGQISTAYLGYNGTTYVATGFPIDQDGADNIAPANVTEAFAQPAWNYGKIGCVNKITRLSDIELSIGRLWTCGDCAWSSWELGLVIPTGNKPTAEWVAPAVVGNGQHAGIRIGSITSLMLTESDESSTWYRLDMDARYLFRNTQKRSFDLLGNEWSRYMMVWDSADTYTAAVSALVAPLTANPMNSQRGYTPGINVFTTDFYIKPQFQGRLNSAVMYAGEHFQAEIGWNTFVRQKECVELACGWDSAPAFADSSYLGGIGLNNNRTIYNDSQTTVANAVDSAARGWTLALPLEAVAAQGTAGNSAASQGLYIPASTAANNLATASALYENFAIGEELINLDSVSTPAAITQTPYLTLGYAFDYECVPTVAVGASYEFTSSNRALSQWMVWGKFECAF